MADGHAERTTTDGDVDRSTDGLVNRTRSLLSGDGDRDATDSRSRWARWRVPTIFSLRAFLAFAAVLVVGAGLGVALVPTLGPIAGVFVASVLVGALSPTRLYLEVTLASLAVAGTVALFNHLFSIVVTGNTSFAVGASFGILATVIGYYFGRRSRRYVRHRRQTS